MNLQNVINPHQSRIFKGCLAGAACLLASATLSAETLVYDGFGSYAQDSDLAGQGGGTGWTSNWQLALGSTPNYFGGSGSIAPDTLDAEDGYMYTTGVSNTSLGREYGSAVVPTGETEMWFSFAFNRGGPKKFGVNPLSNSTNFEAGQFLGIRSENDSTDVVARIRYAGSSGVDDSSAFTMDGSTDYFIYGQAVFGSGSTTLNVWILERTADLTLLTGAEPATLTVTSTSFDSADQDSLDAFAIGSGASVSPSLDEIRIGTSFGDVVTVIPEPSSYALLGGTLVLGLAMARRRK